MTTRAGIIAVQGDVREHASAIERAGAACGYDVEAIPIRTAGLVPECDVLAIPGGESTTISRLLSDEGIDVEIRSHVAQGKPVLATCAGLIVCARDAQDRRVRSLDCLPVAVERNAFGRQVDSFEAPIDVAGLDDPFPAVFIRAPVVSEVAPEVTVLATWDGRPVAVRYGAIVGTSFHPELTDDHRMHQLALFDTR